MSDPKFFIYALIDPDSGQIRYIGKSCGGMRVPRRHANEGELKRSHNPLKRNWIRSLLVRGLTYQIDILERFSSNDGLSRAECDWIAEARRVGVDLFNITDGAENEPGTKLAQSTKDKISATLKGRKLPPSTCEKMSIAQRARKRLPETYQKIAAALFGSEHTPETRSKISIAGKRRFSALAERAKYSTTILTYLDRTMTIVEWADEIKIDYKTLKARLRKGWSIEKTLTTPVRFSSRWHGKSDAK